MSGQNHPSTDPLAEVLVVEDDLYLRENLQAILDTAGYRSHEARTGHQALDLLRTHSIDLVLLDLKLERSRLSGMDVLRQMADDETDVPVVIVSGEGTIQAAVEATQLGAYDFLEKPVGQERILLTVRNALETLRLQRERDRLLAEAGEAYRMVGSSRALRKVYDLVDRAARTNAKVLITGESGSGKELVAHAIHQKSARSEDSFVVINAAAFPDALIESELFGYEEGAFTGARRAHKGKFEQADGGTLFLDEIGDMALQTQAKMLRALQSGEVLPLGGESARTVDVRLIAATNKDLAAEVQAGRFRHDLYFRLNVIPIRVPPLRERQEDIPALIDHFLLDFWKEDGLPLKRLTASAQALLAKQDWPGNIRELRNAIERLVVLSEEDCITAEDVADALDAMETVPMQKTPPLDSPSPVVPLQEAVAQYERACIIQALIAHDWNRQDTADALGINRTYLWRKMQRYQIEAP
jgi:two-component system nitrogen regulation response regulator NtrX